MSVYHDEDFCRRCGRPYEEHESDGSYVEIDATEATEYIFDQLLEDGIISNRDDIMDTLTIFMEFMQLKQEAREE